MRTPLTDRHFPAPLPLVAAVLAVLALVACEDECERLSDCPRDFVCVDGTCEPGTSGGGGFFFPDANDVGTSTNAGLDTGPDASVDTGVGSDASADSGLADAQTDGGADGGADAGAITLDPRTEVWVREVQVLGGRALEVQGILQDRSSASFLVTEQTFQAPGGETCFLRQEQRLTGSPMRIFVPRIRVSTTSSAAVSYTLVSTDLSGRYSPQSTPVAPYLRPMERVLFVLERAPATSPRPALVGAMPTPGIRVPMDIAGLMPSPTLGIDLDTGNSFTWNPSGNPTSPAAALRFEATTEPDQDIRLSCLVNDLGTFTLPASAGQAFEAARGTRSAVLRVYRRSATEIMVNRLDGGADRVLLRVELGARYIIR